MQRAFILLMCIGLVTACSGGEPAARPDTIKSAEPAPELRRATNLIDSAYLSAAGDSVGWNYRQTATVDLNGDGSPERVVLTAQVEMMRGRPLWDDGQPWQLYVQAPDGRRTHMFSRYVQLGTLSLRLTQPDSGQSPRIVLLEHLPDRLAIYEGEYKGPGQLTVSTAYERSVDPRGELASPSLP